MIDKYTGREIVSPIDRIPVDFEKIGPDPALVDSLREILSQHRKIIEFNEKVIKALLCPAYKYTTQPFEDSIKDMLRGKTD